MVELLLSKGANANAQSESGKTALMLGKCLAIYSVVFQLIYLIFLTIKLLSGVN